MSAEQRRLPRLEVEPLHADFAAQIGGVQLGGDLSDELFAEILRALDRYGVLVFADQDLDDARHIAFSERFGTLERMLKGSVGNGSPLAGITNVDPNTDRVFSPEDHRMQRQYSNELWHTDSSFKATSAWISLLHAKEVPPVGADTAFACMRRAWLDLEPDLQAECEHLAAEHDFVYSRSILNDGTFLSDAQKAEVPPVAQRLVLTNPRNDLKSLYLGSHAARIIGWPRERGRALLDRLTAHATQDQYVYTHRWRARQLVMWDDRATMHRGSAWDYQAHRRVMVRTTVSGASPTITRQELDEARRYAQGH